jgi:2-polyprenyl-6-hydroxyphenyl methylase/3-demethylubiquinone-9 3-methyltransferase
MTEIRAEKCPICLQASPESFGEWRWDINGVGYRLVRCPSCCTAFTDPIPDDAALQAFYGSSYDFRWFRDHYEAKIIDCRLRVKEYQPFLGRRILDLGGGFGYFSRAARAKGFECISYDPYFDREEPEPATWDTVVALHVIEHANSPDRFMDTVKRYLSQGGTLILAVPNFAGRGYRELGMGWVWAQPPFAHIFHLRIEGLRSLLTRHGFSIISESYHERWDANCYADVEHVEKFRKKDLDWFRMPYARWRAYRKYIAIRNAYLRYRGMHKAGCCAESDAAELQVIASLRK